MDYQAIAAGITRDADVWDHVLPADGVTAKLARQYAHSSVFFRTVFAPRVTTSANLAVFAHEAGHVATSPIGKPKDPITLIGHEYMASKWGADAVRRHGGRWTAFMDNEQRVALQTYIDGLGVMPLDPAIVAFMQGESL